MKNLSTGTGLALLATAIVAYPIVNRVSSVDQTAHASVPVAAIAAAATAQANPEPTIVWYGVVEMTPSGSGEGTAQCVYRSWSDGKIEMRRVRPTQRYGNYLSCQNTPEDHPCVSPWYVINNPAQGLTYRSDTNFDERVDAADLSQMLADWGDAPRYDILPSDCPLNLINP